MANCHLQSSSIIIAFGHLTHDTNNIDHAQWEIKLGDDAMMTSVRAAFTGQELKITGKLCRQNNLRMCRTFFY